MASRISEPSAFHLAMECNASCSTHLKFKLKGVWDVSKYSYYGDAYPPRSSCPLRLVLSAHAHPPGRRLCRLRPFFSAIMSKPLPAPPRRFDLVESFDALALAGKKPIIDKKLPDPPRLINQPANTFVGGFNPESSVALVSRPRPPPGNAARAAPPPEARAASKPIVMPMPVPQTGKQSLTMQYALKSLRLDTPMKPALAPPFVTVPPRPHSDSIMSPKAGSRPPLSAVTGAHPTINVNPSRPRAVSVPLSPATSSLGKNTAQCSGMTKAGKQCSRQVKLPPTHSHLDPTPVLYCHQHKEVMISAQTGFYVRKVGNPDRFVEFSRMRTLEVK